MTEKQLKKSMLDDIGDVKYWIYALMKELEKDDTNIQQLDWMAHNVINCSAQLNKFIGAFDMLQLAKKENGK